MPTVPADCEYKWWCMWKWPVPQFWPIMAESADADRQTCHMTHYDAGIIVAACSDLVERSRHAQHDLITGLAAGETVAQVVKEYPLPKHVSSQTGLRRLEIASAHRNLRQGRDNLDLRSEM